MKLLAFDTSTDTLSIAVQHGDRVLEHSGPGAAQASASLIGALGVLLDQAGLTLDALDALVVGRGPGSFTGVRTACSVAQGLAFGARGGQGLPVLGVDTLLAVAEQARLQQGCTQVLATLDARMDQVYWAACRWQDAADGGYWQTGQTGQTEADIGLCAPQDLRLPPACTTAVTTTDWVVAGNAQAAYGQRLLPQARHVPALPTAAALLRLAPALLARGLAAPAQALLPRYVRDKVAQTTAEREAAKRTV